MKRFGKHVTMAHSLKIVIMTQEAVQNTSILILLKYALCHTRNEGLNFARGFG